MSQLLDLDVKELVVANSSFGPNEISNMMRAIAENHLQFRLLREAVQELEAHPDRSPATSVRLGVGLYLLGRYESAARVLSNADGGALAYFYLGKSYKELGEHEKAIQSYQSAQMGGYNKDACALAIAEAQRSSGNTDAALRTL
ncbi:MAG TPA: tetratricopeptide repeat protein, partial [Pirellulaceae bacterium]